MGGRRQSRCSPEEHSVHLHPRTPHVARRNTGHTTRGERGEGGEGVEWRERVEGWIEWREEVGREVRGSGGMDGWREGGRDIAMQIEGRFVA